MVTSMDVKFIFDSARLGLFNQLPKHSYAPVILLPLRPWHIKILKDAEKLTASVL